MKPGDNIGKIMLVATAVMNQKTGYKKEETRNRNKWMIPTF
jgi:hypothetical protein